MFDNPQTRYIIGHEAEKWRVKPFMTLEEYQESPATVQYDNYETYLESSASINAVFDEWAWRLGIEPTETTTETLRDSLNILLLRLQRMTEKRRINR